MTPKIYKVKIAASLTVYQETMMIEDLQTNTNPHPVQQLLYFLTQFSFLP